MKVALLLLLVGAAWASPLINVSEEQILTIQLRNALDLLVQKCFDYVRWLLQRHQPFDLVPAIQKYHIKDDNVDLVISASDLKISKAQTFTIDKISNNVPALKAFFGLSIPEIHVEGNYEISGKAFSKAVSGKGSFVADVNKFVQTGDIQFKIVDHSLQIDTLSLDFDIGTTNSFKVNGLSVEGMNDEELESYLNNDLVPWLKQNKALVTSKTAERVTAIVNQFLKGHSLLDIISWLKEIVASTPDPPPFLWH